MLKNIDQKLLTLDGLPASDGQKEVSIKDVILDCLMDATLMPSDATGEQKLEQYLLAVRCKNGGEIEFTVEELSLLKKLAGKKYAPLVVGQFYQFCD